MTTTKALIHTALMAFVAIMLIACNGVAPPNLPDDKLQTASKGSTTDEESSSAFPGCVSASPLSTTSIRVRFTVPAGSEEFYLLRNGVEVYSTQNPASMIFDDTGLVHGETYTYTCKAKFADGVGTGTVKPSSKTRIMSAPVFSGVDSVAQSNASSALVTWGAPTGGAKTKKYKIYKKVGGAVDWNSVFDEVPDDEFGYLATALGDQLSYTFGVRACTDSDPISGNVYCDTNTATASITLPDTGAAATLGAMSVTPNNGTLEVSFPWSDSLGAVLKRRVYRNTTGGTNLGTYTLIRTVNVADLAAPETSFQDNTVVGGNTYYYWVRDEDPSGNINTNTNIVSYLVGDIISPTFSGITGLALGAPTDTVIRATFSSIDETDSSNSNNISEYLVYLTNATPPAVPADPCTSGTLNSTIPTAARAAGVVINYDITSLAQRTAYRVCIKARDASGNISATSSFLGVTTRDITAPTFDGVQALNYNAAQSRLEVTWNPSSSTDIKEYKMRVWKASDPGNVTTLVKTHADFAGGYNITNDITLDSASTIYVVVNACDNASPDFGSQNCTSYADGTALSVTLPDTLAPAGFLGINSVANCSSRADGCVKVTWFAPVGNNWTDYRGFKIYTVAADDSLTWLRDCACSGSNCPNQILTCDVNGLSPYSLKNFYVRAYDAVGNITTAASPFANSRQIRVDDVTPPTFNSAVATNYQADPEGYVVSWSTAVDNQYSGDGNVLTYTLYRKAGSNFTAGNVAAGSPDGSLLYSGTNLNYLNVKADVVEGTTYYYLVCVQDSAANKYCDNSSAVRTVPDLTPPAGFAGITTVEECAVRANGCMKVNWTAPADWTDYTGFTVYSVDAGNNLTVLGVCPCSGNNCPNMLTSCEVISADHYRTLNYFVRAYDASANYTSAAGAFASSTQAKTDDVTLPTHALPLISVVYQSDPAGAFVTWLAAADNQYVEAGNDLTYTVYRKAGADFSGASIVSASPDGSLVETTTSLSSLDTPEDLVEGTTYYYTVCAQDKKGNKFCNGDSQSIVAPDTTPPAGFAGISGVANCTVRANGCVKVSWFPPADWTDYRGFKVYTVTSDNTMTEVKNCACSGADCPDTITSCEHTFAQAYRLHRFYVRAYDATGNMTAAPTPYVNGIAQRTDDINLPNYAVNGVSGLFVGGTGNQMSWNADATDNQYNDGVNNIRYKIYRKQAADFIYTLGIPDGSLKTTTTNATYTDPVGTMIDGITYYYTVCAIDSIGNEKCPVESIPLLSPDITPPVIGVVTANPAVPQSGQSYALSWTVSDNSGGNVNVTVRKKFTDTPGEQALDSDPVVDSNVNLTTVTAQYADFTTDWGAPAGSIPFKRFVSYKISATDGAGNTATSHMQVTISGIIVTTSNRVALENIDWVIPSGATVTFAIPEASYGLSLSINSLTIQNGGVLTHNPCVSPNCYKIDLDVVGAVIINSGGSIDVTGKGYPAGKRIGFANIGACSANYAGSSGTQATQSCVYGDIKTPQHHGPGNGFAGGGVVKLVADSLLIDGSILSNGAGEGSGNAAGGSIWIDVNAFGASSSGLGSIKTLPSTVNSPNNYASGGRIAIYYSTISNFNLNDTNRLASGSGAPWNALFLGGTTYTLQKGVGTYGDLKIISPQFAGTIYEVPFNHPDGTTLDLDNIYISGYVHLRMQKTTHTVRVWNSVTVVGANATMAVPTNGAAGTGYWFDTTGATVTGTITEY